MKGKMNSTVRDISVIKDGELNIKQVRSLVKTKLVLSTVNIDMLLKNSLNMIKEEARKHGIKLSMNMNGVPPMIKGDETKLRQILYNLLSNAVRYTPSGGKVHVDAQMVDCIVRPGRRQGDAKDLYFIKSRIDGIGVHDTNRRRCIQFSVSDTGIGLKSQDLERIFNVFEQVKDPIAHRHQGLGLGLYLAKRLVELHGGIIWAESDGRGKGSAFAFIIPGLLTGDQQQTEKSAKTNEEAIQSTKALWRELFEEISKKES